MPIIQALRKWSQIRNLKSSLDYMRSPLRGKARREKRKGGRQEERKEREREGRCVWGQVGEAVLTSPLSCLSYRMSQAARTGPASSANQTFGGATSKWFMLVPKSQNVS